MPQSTSPIVWEFYQQNTDATQPGGMIHYFNEEAQSLYLKNGDWRTTVKKIQNGDWKNAIIENKYQINHGESWQTLEVYHPDTNVWYAIAVLPNRLKFNRYMYKQDIASIVNSYDITYQVDSPVVDVSFDIQNINNDLFSNLTSIYQPGSKINIAFTIGNSDSYQLSTQYVDEVDYGVKLQSTTLDTRNTIGKLLKDQYTNDLQITDWYVQNALTSIFEHAGITDFDIQYLPNADQVELKPDEDLLALVDNITDLYENREKYKILETSSGKIIVGYPEFTKTYLPNTVYTFDAKSDIFLRESTKSIDDVYRRVRATSVDTQGEDLQPVTVDIDSFRYWNVGMQKTLHIKPEGIHINTQERLQEWTEDVAKSYSYAGITEKFETNFRPNLLIGDVARVLNDGVETNLGLITEIKHSFDKKTGWKTTFTVSSGGVFEEIENVLVYTKQVAAHGYNRIQTITDLVRVANGG